MNVVITKLLPENFAQMLVAESEDAAWELLTKAERYEMAYLNEGAESMWEAWAEQCNEYVLGGSDDRPSMPQAMDLVPDPIWFQNFMNRVITPLRAAEAEPELAPIQGPDLPSPF